MTFKWHILSVSLRHFSNFILLLENWVFRKHFQHLIEYGSISLQQYMHVYLVMVNLITLHLIFWNLGGSLIWLVFHGLLYSLLPAKHSNAKAGVALRNCNSVRACREIRQIPRLWQLHQYRQEGRSTISCTETNPKLIAWAQWCSMGMECWRYLILKLSMSKPWEIWPRDRDKVTIICANNEIKFLLTAETS